MQTSAEGMSLARRVWGMPPIKFLKYILPETPFAAI
jgi:hypothetical protein